MKRAALFGCILLLAVLRMGAQQNEQRPSSSAQQTVRGCLSGSGTTYILTDESGRTWQLQASAETLNMLKDHVGQEVSITGTPGSASATSAGASSTAGSATSIASTNPLQVSDVQRTHGTCSADEAGPGSAATGSGGASGAATPHPGVAIAGSAAGETAQLNNAASGSTEDQEAGGTTTTSTQQISGSSPREILASAEQAEAQRSQAVNLPQTASPLPWVAMTGFWLLAAGLIAARIF